MTAEELLAAMAESLEEDGTYCTIDPETRVITIPPEYQLLGVESDEKAERIYFKCPKIVGDDIDLSKLALRVNFRNAGQVVDQYLVDDVAVDGDNITFSWLLSRRVTQYEGDVNFIVCAVRVSGETITNEWNTTLATAQVLEGLEAEMVLPEEETDIVNQLLSLAETRLNDVKEATADANTAASNANQKAQEAENAAEDARGVTEQITKDSYLHTALQSFIDTVTARPTAYGNAIVKKIGGFIRQETTTGAQLIDFKNPIKGEATGSATYRILGNGKISVTGSKTTGYEYIQYRVSSTLIKGKTIYVYCTYPRNGEDKPLLQLVYKSASMGGTQFKSIQSSQWTEVSIPSDMTGNLSVQLYPTTVDNTSTATCIFEDLKVGLSQFNTWEPYTGGQPAPNPDYPMEVQGTGYRGFLDGELLQGYYKTADGILSTGMDYVFNKNMIPCKPGDNIALDISINSSAVFLLYYDTNGKYVSHKALNAGSHFKTIVPASIYGFNFDIQKSGGLTPDAVGPITITINGKYAVCVKSEGINLCSGVESGDYLHRNGKPSSAENYVRTNKMIVKPNTVYKESSVIEGTVTKTAVFWDENETFIKYSSFDSDIQTPSNCKYMALNYYADGLTVSKVRNVMITEKSVFPNTYVPYQSNVSYIPVDYPLFEGDKIVQRNGEYKLLREWKQVIYDGSEDEEWTTYSYQGNYNGVKINIADMKIGARQPFYCSRFRNTGVEDITGIWFGVNDNTLYVIFGDSNIATDVSSFKTWLQSNPVTVVYELAAPTEELLSPEAQKALHSIMATDEQTELTIAGVPADAGIQNQFLLPRNEDGALNTTAYCTAEKNKIVLNELVAQNLDARVNKLEIDNATLAEQTIIVE